MLSKWLQNSWDSLRRAFQDFVVFCVFFVLLFGPFLWQITVYLLLCNKYYFSVILYILWYIYDVRICEKGGRASKWYRQLFIWKHVLNYLNVKIIKTAELPPTKNYLLCYHPHGLYPIGMLALATDIINLKEIFPGLVFRPLLMDILLQQPIYRECMVPFGMCNASKKGIDWLLTNEGTGNAVVLTVGGAAEALYAHPGSATLVLKQRQGFVKIALQHGVPLVPVFGFGETDLFKQVQNPEGSRLRRFQNKFQKLFKYSIPLFYGERFLVMPAKKPITIVVGEPIHVKKIPEPTEEDINKTHKMYIESLTQLFKKHKEKYGPHMDLKIV